MEDDHSNASFNHNNSLLSPTKDDLRFIPDCDLISSEDSEGENDIYKPQKYNQLLPRGKLVFKLLNSIKPHFQNTWSTNFGKDNSSITPNSDLVNNIDSDSGPSIEMAPKRKLDDVETSDQERSKKRVKRHPKNGDHSMSDSENSEYEVHLNNQSGTPSREVQNCVDAQSDSMSSPPKRQNSDAQSKETFKKPSPLKRQSGVVGVNLPQLTPKRNEVQEKHYRTPKLSEEDKDEISKYSSLLHESLLEKYNVWILQCPAQMDCSALVNQRLDLGGSSQLSVGDSVFETYSYPDRKGRAVTMAVPSDGNHFQLCRIPVAGNIIMEEIVQPGNTKFNIPEPPCVELPSDLRTRHPLLGLDYSKQSRTAPRRSPKKKRHRRDTNGSEGLVESPQEIKKKKKKKKHSTDYD